MKCDWLRQVVFMPNLKYLHAKITVSVFIFEAMTRRFRDCDRKELVKRTERNTGDDATQLLDSLRLFTQECIGLVNVEMGDPC